MNNQNDIYLTSEVSAYAKKNQGLDPGGLINVGITEAISITLLLALLIFFGTILHKKFLTDGATGGKLGDNEMLGRFMKGIPILIILLSVFQYYNLLNFSTFLPALTQSSPKQEVLDPSPVIIQKEIDAGTGPAMPSGNADALFKQVVAGEKEAREVLAAQKIAINAAACTGIGKSGCTTVGGMSNSTLAMLAELKKLCDCTMTVTGGTEWWLHSAKTKHKPGNTTAVDLRKETNLDSYIKNSSDFKKITSWSTCAANYSWRGFNFCDEIPRGGGSAHWHIEPL